MADNNYTDKEVDGLDDTAGRVETYHNAVYITVKRYGREIKEGWAKFDPVHGREFAARILAACDVADGLPARPVAIEDVPLQYVARADTLTPSEALAEVRALLSDSLDEIEEDGWLRSDYNAGIDGGIEGDSD